MYYRLIISYKGTRFYGWQKQPKDLPTVQGSLEKALSIIFNSNDIKSIAAGRTDRGVHALQQVVKITVPQEMECPKLQHSLNSILDTDIRVHHVDISSSGFHPIRDTLWKEYCYLFSPTQDVPTPITSDFITHIYYPLDMGLMKQAAGLFIGKKDFCNYYTTGDPVDSTVKEIYTSAIGSVDSSPDNGILPNPTYSFTIRGNGFLKHMVRLIFGSLIEVGREKVTIEEIVQSLEQPRQEKLGPTAPAKGLILSKIHYH